MRWKAASNDPIETSGWRVCNVRPDEDIYLVSTHGVPPVPMPSMRRLGAVSS